jgi:hypothetical protein
MKLAAVHPTRRSFLKAMLAAMVAPLLVPARLLAAGQAAPSNKVTLGVIGVGAQGQYDMRNFLGHDDVRVTAICDVNRRNIGSAQRLIANAYGSSDAKVYADFRELNADASIDAVLMALPVHWHSIPAQDTILHGKHIYHEKPMGLSFEEARRVRGGRAQDRCRVPVRHAATVRPVLPLGVRVGPERPAGQAQGDPGVGPRRQERAAPP